MIEEILSEELEVAAVELASSRWLRVLSEEWEEEEKGAVKRINDAMLAAGKVGELYAASLRRARGRFDESVPDANLGSGSGAAPTTDKETNASSRLGSIREADAKRLIGVRMREVARAREIVIATDVPGARDAAFEVISRGGAKRETPRLWQSPVDVNKGPPSPWAKLLWVDK